MNPEYLHSIISSWLLVGALAVISMFWLWTKSRISCTIENIPPFPVQPWPIVGHFLMLSGNMRDKMKVWQKISGSIYSLCIGRQLNIIVNDYEDIKEIMKKYSDNIINTPHSFTNDILCEENKGIVEAKDDNWKQQRTTSVSILRSFGMGKNLMAVKIQEEVSYLNEKISALKGQPVNPKSLLYSSVSNVICSVVVGERFHHDDSRFVSILESIKNIIKYGMTTILLTPVKKLYYLPWDLFHAKKWAKAALNVSGFVKIQISKFKEISNENDEPNNFITAYLKEMRIMKEKGVKSDLSEANLVAIIRTMFVAGTESTSSTIMWCLLYMLHYPHVQEKVYNQIEATVGTDRLPSWADRSNLPYLNAVLMETQRMASVVPTGLRREVSKSFEHRGFTFPVGSVMWPILDSVHYDTQIWGDPEVFRPERFIDKNGALVNREELIPFCIGRRICLGESLARMELFLFLSAMFQRFSFKLVGENAELPSLKASYAVVCMCTDFQMQFVARRE